MVDTSVLSSSNRNNDISSTSYSDNASSVSSLSAITLDESLEKSNYKFASQLKSTPEDSSIRQSSEHNLTSAKKLLDELGMNSSHRFRTSLGPTLEPRLCDKPERKKSSRDIQRLDKSIFLDDSCSDFCSESSEDPLEGSFSCDDYEEVLDKAALIGQGKPSSLKGSDNFKSKIRPKIIPSSSQNSLDLDDIFENKKCNDVSPKAARRKSSQSLTKAALLIADQSKEPSLQGSGSSKSKIRPSSSQDSLDLDDIFESKRCNDVKPKAAKRRSSQSLTKEAALMIEKFERTFEDKVYTDECPRVAKRISSQSLTNAMSRDDMVIMDVLEEKTKDKGNAKFERFREETLQRPLSKPIRQVTREG